MSDDLQIHPLLRRQARRAGVGDIESPPDSEAWLELLGRVSGTYTSADRDRYLLERSLDLSSTEMQELHARVEADKALLDSVLGALTSGVLHLDADWNITFVNLAGRRLLRHFDLVGESLFDVLKLESADGSMIELERVGRIVRSGRPFVERDVDVVRADETKFAAAVTFNPMMKAEGLVGIVVSLRDISDLKIAEREARNARIEVEAAERARRAQAAFLANMSHELRTPLNAILGYSELVAEESEDYGYTEILPDLGKIGSAARHLLSLINDVLDMSKIQARRIELDVQPTPVGELLEEIRDTVQPLATKNGNTLVLEFPERGCTVETDPLRLKQALLNVVANAIKFTADGTVRVTAAAEPDGVVVRVQDDGIGMSSEVQERIFEPFSQADSSTTRQFGGTGLGLAITGNICEALRISVEVESTPGDGTAFTFRIPLGFVPAYELDAESLEEESLVAYSAPTQEGPSEDSVLLIDDDEATHDLIGRYLQSHEIALVSAHDGRTGIRLAKQHLPSAIILDIVLPDVEGWEVLSILKSDPETASIPLFVVSIVADAPRAFRLGAQDYLVKPVERERLVATLERFRGDRDSATVLVVEDDDDLRHLMCAKIARSPGAWQIGESESGVAACRYLEENPRPDLILLDLMMPEMDGFQFLEVLEGHAEWRSIPVVVVTAMELTAEQRQRLDLQVARIIQKGQQTPAAIAEHVAQKVQSLRAARDIGNPAMTTK